MIWAEAIGDDKIYRCWKTQAGTNHPVNEDRLLLDGNVLCCGLVGDCEREMGCMAVFDGVSEGGHGAAASTLAAQAFAQVVRVFDADSVNALQDRLRVAGERAENDVESYAARYGLPVAASTLPASSSLLTGTVLFLIPAILACTDCVAVCLPCLAMTTRLSGAWAALALNTETMPFRIVLSWRLDLTRVVVILRSRQP